ncbi:MAG: hypothetical protein ACPGSM_19880, partial [Thiolinea sp.]
MNLVDSARATLQDIETAGMMKHERLLLSPQASTILTASDSDGNQEVLNLCANNYLGLANDS